MSMLDVICSALGAFLVLFIVTMMQASSQEKRAEMAEKSLKQTKKALAAKQKEASEALKKAAKAIEEAKQARAKAAAAAAARKAAAAAAAKARIASAKGVTIGQCETSAAQVTFTVWDHGGVDNDRVKLAFNKKVLRRNLTLQAVGNEYRVTRPLDVGPNILEVTALSEGDNSPNTAAVRVNPCRQHPQPFPWDMKTGQSSNIVIIRK